MKRILTGIKPSAEQFHIGNYLGAIKPMLDFQSTGHDMFMFIPNIHALNIVHDKETLKRNTYNAVRTYLACGLDPTKATIYLQSDVTGHTELQSVLAAITPLGFMKRMHSYKDALAKGDTEDFLMGTFNYPILMAADILLYDVHAVPVGKDQKQHLEYTRDIAIRFNHMFGETFVVPEPIIVEEVATIAGLDGRKMSKSYNNYIGLFEDIKVLEKKVKTIPTDTKTVEESKNPDECNIYNILKHFVTESENSEIRAHYENGGKGYSFFKGILFEKLQSFLTPLKEKALSYTDEDIKKILREGCQKAQPIATKSINRVYENIGFTL